MDYVSRLAHWTETQLVSRKRSTAELGRDLAAAAALYGKIYEPLSPQAISNWKAGKIGKIRESSREMLAAYRSRIEKAPVPGRGTTEWTVRDIENWLEGKLDAAIDLSDENAIEWAYVAPLPQLLDCIRKLRQIARIKSGLESFDMNIVTVTIHQEFASAGLSPDNPIDVERFMDELPTQGTANRDRLRRVIAGHELPDPRDLPALCRALSAISGRNYTVQDLSAALAID